MAAFLNACRFNPTAGGTTDWTYSSAVTGYQSPAAAAAVNGAAYSYRAESNDLSQWEVGVGTYNAGVLTRATVLFNSSGTTAKINFSTVPQVAIVALAEDLTSTKKNYLINGAMMVSQENGNTAANVGIANYYAVDQFLSNRSASVTAVVAAQQIDLVSPAGSPKRLRHLVTSAQAVVAAGDLLYFSQAIEGVNFAELAWGTASARPVTLSFVVRAPAGTYCVAFRNSAADRFYIAEYTVGAGEANTDVRKTLTIPGDTSGAWPADNGATLRIFWMLICGSNFYGIAGAWSASGLATSNQFNLASTVNNSFIIGDVGLHEGSIAPAFQVPEFTSELKRCQRYFEASGPGAGPLAVGFTYNTTIALMTYSFKEAKRAVPTFVAKGIASDYSVYRAGANNAIDTVPTMDAARTDQAQIRFTHSTGPFTAGQGIQGMNLTGNGNFHFSARL